MLAMAGEGRRIETKSGQCLVGSLGNVAQPMLQPRRHVTGRSAIPIMPSGIYVSGTVDQVSVGGDAFDMRMWPRGLWHLSRKQEMVKHPCVRIAPFAPADQCASSFKPSA